MRQDCIDIVTRLSQIISRILRDLYNIKKTPLEVRLTLADELHAALRNWRYEAAHFLDLDPTPLQSLYRRQNVALRLSYSYALTILHRPFLLNSFDDNLDVG